MTENRYDRDYVTPGGIPTPCSRCLESRCVCDEGEEE